MIKPPDDATLLSAWVACAPASDVGAWISTVQPKDSENIFRVPFPENSLKVVKARGEPFLDLMLALYGDDAEVLAQLWQTGDKAIRRAILGNKNRNAGGWWISTELTFCSNELLQEFLATGDIKDIELMVTNPTFRANALSCLFEKKWVFADLPKGRWEIIAVLALMNQNLHKSPHEFHRRYSTDPIGELSEMRPASLAVRVLFDVPAEENWALSLDCGFIRFPSIDWQEEMPDNMKGSEKAGFRTDSYQNFLERAFARWTLPPKGKTYPGAPSADCLLRMTIACKGAKHSSKIRDWLENHPDKWVRLGAAKSKLFSKTEEIKEWYDREGWAFLDAVMSNEFLHHRENRSVVTLIREMLHDSKLWKAAEKDGFSFDDVMRACLWWSQEAKRLYTKNPRAYFDWDEQCNPLKEEKTKEDAILTAIQKVEQQIDKVKEAVNYWGNHHNPKFEYLTSQIVGGALRSERIEQVRARLSKETDVRLGELDKMLGAKIGEARESSGQGQALVIEEPAPYDAEIDGAALLDDITTAIKNHVILPDKGAEAVTLWLVMTYGVDIFDCLPRLYIHSPERECGKTTLLNCVSRLAWRSLPSSNISSASTFRVIEMAHPTLCLDESDTFLRENLELRGVINSGHTRATAFTIRNVGEDHEPRQFSTYTPIAIAGIGRIHDTTESRSIIIAMRRKKKGEKVKKLLDKEREPFATLARKIRRWVNDNKNKLAQCNPAMPEALGDRAADNWRPLLAIADAAGGEWPERARQAAAGMSTGGDAATASYRTQLLADIKAVFDARNVDKIPSKELADALAGMEGHPWAEYGRLHKPITQHALAHLLADFGIVPGTIRIGEKNTPKGYKRDQFADAWERYLLPTPHESTATPPQGAENLYSPADFETPQDDDGGGLETAGDTWETADCGDVADDNTPYSDTEA